MYFGKMEFIFIPVLHGTCMTYNVTKLKVFNFMKNKCDSIFDKKQFFIMIKCNSKEHSPVQLKKNNNDQSVAEKYHFCWSNRTVGNLKTVRFKAA